MSGRTFLQGVYRNFYPNRDLNIYHTNQNNKTNIIGGTIYENSDLDAGRYRVVEDLHVMPGAKLSLSPGTVFEFADGVGMLVQGEGFGEDI